MAESLISDISDTARWVATYRAAESARPDALFDDFLAAELAGRRGAAIAAAAKRTLLGAWFFVARTKLIDDMIATCVARGCDRVINLAAGLDTRPYRLELPPELEWHEADLPAMIDEKQQRLALRTPRCRISRHRVDLADPQARRDFLDSAVEHADKTVVITEGLLLYLAEAEVRSLSADLTRPEIAWWITDIISPAFVALSKPALRGKMNNLVVKFGPAAGIGYFEPLGWTVEECSSHLVAADRWHRLPPLLRPFARLPQPDPRRPGWLPTSAVALLGRRPD
ncbi:class I SAM-dependent methyltransferase [Nocardia vulneris]|uniref:S-adenosyl-L-methionine-dependent methyltransferase n=1 Tax=Nocardia vulneris TaxID=1141657 RepID=A0ABR4Z7X2_9NOCA|nr:SAM-dependent methyltransferase [Nocardia vulneris]KIA61392.1 methyltransferase [Nocardia vulneris]